jgi:N-acetylglucosamine kinase-like BadF-type ATPase
MRYFLGVDAGGTKTHALITDEHGLALGFGTGGRGNHQGLGFEGQRAVLKMVTHQALTMAGLRLDELSSAGFGLAGYDWPSQLPAHQASVASLGLSCPCEIVNDSIIGLLAGATQRWGIVLVAGTGNNVRGRDKKGREGRITGEGIRFGEFGGGGELVGKALLAVSYEWSRRGPRTLLTEKFLEITGASDLDELIEGIDQGRYDPNSSWAAAVFEAAHAGDQPAQEAIAWSARELGESAAAVIRQLDLQNDEVEVIQIGGLFEGGALFIEPLAQTILAIAPHAKFIRLNVPPVIGSIVLAMQKINIDPQPVREHLIDSTKALIHRLGVQI